MTHSSKTPKSSRIISGQTADGGKSRTLWSQRSKSWGSHYAGRPTSPIDNITQRRPGKSQGHIDGKDASENVSHSIEKLARRSIGRRDSDRIQPRKRIHRGQTPKNATQEQGHTAQPAQRAPAQAHGDPEMVEWIRARHKPTRSHSGMTKPPIPTT